MKRFLIYGAVMLLAAGNVQALDLGVQGGDGYVNAEVGLGTASSGLAISGNWTHNDSHGDAGGLGLGLSLPLGPVMATVGGKALYLDPQHGDTGGALAVGGGLQWQLSDHFALYGSGYYAPEDLTTSHVGEYEEGNAGLRWTVIKPLNVNVGYRYVNIGGKDGRRDETLADGLYLGVGLRF